MAFFIFHRTRTNHSKICMKSQKIPNSQNNLKKHKAEDTTIPDFKLY